MIMKYLKRTACMIMSFMLVMAFILAPSLSAPAQAHADTTSVENMSLYLSNINTAGVSNGAEYFQFTVPDGKELHLQAIVVYHYYYGIGSDPGVISLSNINKELGSWQSSNKDENNNFYWVAYPDITLSAGTYYITCPDSTTWAYNADSESEGFTELYGDISTAASKPNKGVVSKITNVKGAKAKVTVKSVNDATKYQIRYKVGTSKKWTTSKKTKSRTFTIKVTKGKTVKVQARVTNKAGTGAWGKTKSFKTDKK